MNQNSDQKLKNPQFKENNKLQTINEYKSMIIYIIMYLFIVILQQQGIPLAQGNLKNQNDQFISILLILILSFFVLLSQFQNGLEQKNILNEQLKHIQYISDQFIKFLFDSNFKYNIEKLFSSKREIDVIKCQSNDPKRFIEDLADCIKQNVYCELRLVSIVKKSKLLDQISRDNLNQFKNHFENEKYDDFKTIIKLIKNVQIKDIIHLSQQQNEVLIDQTYLKNLICQIEIIFKEIKKKNIDQKGNEYLRDFKDIICQSELLQDKNQRNCNSYQQATSLYEISIKLKDENAQDKNSDQLIRKQYYEPQYFELQSTQFIYSVIDSLDQGIHNKDKDFQQVIIINGKKIPINIRYAEDKMISTIGNKISRKDDLLSDENIPWSISLIKDFKRMSITFNNEYDIYLQIMQRKIKFGHDFTKEFISQEHNIRIRIAEIKNGFFGLNSFDESGDQRDVKIIYEFFIPDQDISQMMECQLNLNELVQYKKAEHIIYDFLRCENDMLSVKKLKEMYSWQESNIRIFLYNLRLIFVILAIATIGISTGVILNQFSLDQNLILHSNYQKKFQFIQGLYPDNYCQSINKKLQSCIGNKLFQNILNNNKYNNYKKLVLSEEQFIGINKSSNLFQQNLIDYSKFDSSLKISDIQINNNILCKLISNTNDLECNHKHVYPRIIDTNSQQLCISANNRLECFGDLYTEFNYEIPLKVQSGVDQLSMGSLANCAIKQTKLQCWGNNQQGQLDIPEILIQQEVTILSTGNYNICAGSNEILVCWGRETQQQQDLTVNSPPEVVSKGVEILSANGKMFVCAVASGELQCWGFNENGFDDIPMDKRQGISMMTTGFNNICIQIDSLNCQGNWGANNPPDEISQNTLIIKINISLGCASTIDNFLCWGQDEQSDASVQIPDQQKTGVDQIALGNLLCFSQLNNYECLSLISDFEIPQVNETASNNYNLPIQQDNLADFEIGGYFCLQKSILYCKARVLDKEQIRVPREIIFSTNFSIGRNNACALSPTNSLVCIGKNLNGENDVPSALLTKITLQTIGLLNTCASTPDVFLCWGRNESGQLDIPDSMANGVQVMTIPWKCTCAGTQYEFKCWGDLHSIGGEIRDELVGGVDKVHSSGLLVCASKGDRFFCFGLDSNFGVLDVPAQFVDNGVDFFGVGFNHVCAQKDINFLCWGRNASNQCQIPTHLQGGVDFLRTLANTNCANYLGNWICFGEDFIDFKFLVSEIHAEKLVFSFTINGDQNLCIKYNKDTVYCQIHSLTSGEFNFKVKEDLMCMQNGDNNIFLCYTDRVNSNQFICNSIISNSEGNIKQSQIGDSEVINISCGLNHGCAMFQSGEAICFGGSTQYNEADLPNSMITEVYDIRAGDNSTCIINTTQILCIGKPIIEENLIQDLSRQEGFESLRSQLDR